MTQSGECERDPAEAAGSAGEQPEDASGESIVAIVGLACRFPGAPDADTYWRNLCDGVESIGFFSDAELERAGVARRLLDDPSYVRAGGCLPDIETFDAEFFGINPREAEVMDPQHRLFLECAWEALENAGCDSERYDGRIGVLGGVGVNGYAMTNLLGRGALAGRVGALQASIRNRTDHLTTHVCYKLDLRGPGITVQTACSTSLVAVHLACQSLLNGECDMALAGGASLAIPHRTGYLYQEGGILSPDGHCRAFDAEAAGTVPGSGAGIVVLKRYEDAIADGDTVVALIRGSAVNNDGSNKVGYTAPGLDGQVEVIAEALGVANVDAQTIGYVEAHGTGTHLGDPIEIEALTRAFGAGADGKKFCAIGSVKSNIGHLDTAAGVAGLIKAALALEHGRIPPSLHYSRPNPQIDFDAGPFYVNAELSDWARAGAPRRAGVSSFGIGGTNAHVVLESAPAPRASSPGRPWQLLTLSAKSAAALEAATQNLAEHLKRPRGVGLADVAYTLQVGRRAFEYRRAVVCREDDAARTLETLDPARVYTATTQPNARPVTFMFPGQGAQHVDMARELYETEAAFREELDRCCALLEPELGLDLRQILHPAAAEGGHAAEQLQMTALTQPALFAIEYALARLWIEWGVRPESMIGHSIGEYVAACLAGVLPLPDALRVIAARGRLMQDLPPGGMTIVPMAEHDVEPLLTEELSIAAVNGPAACVVAGPFDALERLEKRLAAEDHVCRRLRTSHAFHSSMMEPMLADFARVLGTVRLAPPRIPYLSNVTGTWIEERQATDPDYWVAHVRRAVRFDDGIRALAQAPDRVFLEVGPGRGLMTLARWHPARSAHQVALTSLPHSREGRPVASDGEWLTTTLGRLWLAGVDVDWGGVHAGEARRRVPLPTYPFQRRRFWIDAAPADAAGRASLENRPDVADWFYAPSWRRTAWPETRPGAASGPEPQSWLLLTDGDALHEDIARSVAGLGCRIVRVEPGDAYARGADEAFTVRPGNAEDYAALLAALDAERRPPARVVHLWNLNGGEARHLDAGFHALSALGRALGTRPSGTALHIDVVTSNMQEVVGGELLWPEKATVLGPCRAIPREYDGVTCRSIDVDTRDSGARPGFAAARRIVGDHIVRELFAWPAMRDTVVAHRGGYRWVQSFDPVRLDAPVEPAPGLRPHGVYLITGGLGGIGLEIAAFLARTVQARLALLGRSAPPPRSEWDDRLAAKPDDALSRRIEAVRAIEACGATVLTLGCDVSDEASLRDAVRRAEDELGGLNGVVHCAGVGGGALLQLQSAAGSAAVLAPKVAGTRALEAVLGDKRLDFVVLCSSRAAILGGFGQSDYCAANAFLDAFAHYRSAVGSTRTVAVDWAGWRDVGMRVDTLSKLGLLEPGAAAGEPIGHPLLHRRIEKTADREVFASVLDVASQWVLDDHRIARQPVVPGTAYLEMVRAAMRTRDPHAALEFSDVYFLNVLPVREDEPQEVRVVLEGAGPELDFRIRSRTVVGGRETWQDHVMGRARTLPPQDAPRRDVDALIRRCNVEHRVIAADDPIVTYEDLGPRWLSMKKVWLGRDELVALLELPPQFADDVAVYELHPALLDRANFTAKVFLAFDGLHLPMGYRAIRIRRPLTPKIYVYAKYKPSGDPLLETITFDVALMDEHGVELVGVDEFSQKRVRDAGEAIKSAAMRSRGPAAPRRVEAAVASRADEPVAGTLSPAEGVDAFRRILATTTAAQIVVSPNDLAAAIEHADRLRQEAIDDAAEDSASPAEEKHARPDLPTEYVAPRGPVEAALAEIWERTLGIEPIGIDDNFFDLGGDSVVGIQLVAQAKKKDLKLSPQQLFGNQTIRELAAALDGAQQGGGAPSAARGHVPLSPPQLQRLERRSDGAERRTRSALLDLRRRVEPALLARAAAQLPLHHDALRLRVERTDNGWLQRCAADTGPSPFAHADLSALPAGAQGEALSRLRRQALDAVDPAAGPLLRVLFVEQRSDFGRLLIVTDDLFVDDASWSILLSDLETVCDQLTRGEPVRLPDAAVSFSEWADSAAEYASSDQLERDLGWWRENLAGAPRPEPAADGDGTRGPKRDAVSSHPDSARVTLGAADTAALLNDGPRRFRMAAGDIIVAALAATLAGAGAGTESRAGADGDRRGGAADDVATGRNGLGADAGKTDAGKTDAGMTDTRGVTIEIRERRHEPAHHEQPARTVGPLSPSFPIVLRANPLEDAGASLTSIKEQLRAVPRGGLGWGAARHARGREDAAVVDAPRVDATCRYVGPIGEPLASSQTFTLIDFDAVAGSGAHGAAAAALDVLAVIRDGELRVEWRRLRTGRGAEPVDCAARRFLERLQTLARHCAGAEAGVYTPSDFPMAKVSQAQLDRIASQLVGQRQS